MLDDLLDVFDRDEDRQRRDPQERRGLRGFLGRLFAGDDDYRDRRGRDDDDLEEFDDRARRDGRRQRDEPDFGFD